MTPLSCLAAVILNTQFSCTRHLLKYKKFEKTSRRGENIHSALTINAETIFQVSFRQNILHPKYSKTIRLKDGIEG